MAVENNFHEDTTLFLNCKQMLNYKFNFLSITEYKYQVSNKSHFNKDKIYLLSNLVDLFYKYYSSI